MRFLVLSFLTTTSLITFSDPAAAQLLTGYGDEGDVHGAQAIESEALDNTPVDVEAGEPSVVLSPLPSSPPVSQQPQSIIQRAPVYPAQDLSNPRPDPYRPLMTYGGAVSSPVHNAGQQEKGEPVDLQADDLSYDEGSEVVTASGDVFLEQAGRILRADQVVYSVGEDSVQAEGNVVLNEANGDIHLADRANYKSKLRDGRVDNVRTTLSDGSRFRADYGEHKGGVETTMHNAHYTPCVPCAESEGIRSKPAWAIRSSEVTHSKEEKRISYKNARFELWGVPVAYTPYFSHPDGSIEQKSGFLAPSFGYKSDLGVFAHGSYYWAIGPDQDATFGVMAMTDQSPLGLLEYRKRWNNAAFEMEGGITNSDRSDRTSSGLVVREDKELRGHIFASSQWDMNNKWRSGFDLNYTSDDQYMRQYDFTTEDVLESQLYAERFSGRNYASARLISFQDIRVREDVAGSLDQPDVLPEIEASFIGEPGAIPVVKGRWSADFSMLGLRREGDEQDMNRFSGDLGWKRRFVSDYGLLTRVDASMRGDAYHTNDRTNAAAGSGRSKSGTDLRFFPQAHVESSYPMARSFETMQATIAPVVSLTAAPKIDTDDYPNIPNEDSNDVQIDTSNLFEPNRFSGLDKIEDQSRVTYGLRTGLYGHSGSYGEIFLGQSYRLDERENPFPRGSGLSNQESDIVGQLTGRYADKYALDYRYQLGSRHLNSRRHELSGSADWERLSMNAEYMFVKGLEGTELDESREQMNGNAAFYLTPRWRVRSGATHDFGENEGLRQAYAGLDYLGQCLFLSLTGEKNFTTEASGDGGTEILFRIGLKNIGEFEESTYLADGAAEKCNF